MCVRSLAIVSSPESLSIALSSVMPTYAVTKCWQIGPIPSQRRLRDFTRAEGYISHQPTVRLCIRDD